MNGWRVEFEGLADAIRALQLLSSDLEDIPAFETLADRLNHASQAAAPKRTGRMAASLHPVAHKNYAAAESKLIYTPFINYGLPSRNIRAQHFLQRASAVVEATALPTLELSIKRLIAQKGLS